MTDYLGPLPLGNIAAGGTYTLKAWQPSGAGADLEVTVRGTSADTLAAAIEVLVAQLRQGNTYAHFEPGVTYPVVYRVAEVSGFAQVQPGTWPAFEQRVSFTLALSAMPQGALTTLYSAQHVDTPASVALAALLGTNPPPLDVTIDDDSGYDMHSVWAALAPTAVSDALWLIKASTMTWVTMLSGTASAVTWVDGTYVYTTSASYQTTNIDTSQYPPGKYRLLARPWMTAGTAYVKDSQNDDPVPVTRTSPHLVHVGDLDLPAADTAPGTAANLTLSVKSDGTNTLGVDAFVLLPLDYGYFSWHHDTATVEIDQLDVGPSGVFMDGVCDTEYLKGNVLLPRTLAAHVGTLVASPSPTGSTWPSDWGRTDSSDVTAADGKFQIATTAGGKYAWYAATVAGAPLVVPGAWYEVTLTRQVTARSAGEAVVQLLWTDVDGNTVRLDTLATMAAVDASPVALVLYSKAPVHAARAWVLVGAPEAAGSASESALSPSADDGFVYNRHVSYGTAAGSWVSGGVLTSGDCAVGQQISAGDYLVYETFLDFDTSALPAEAAVDAVELELYVNDESSDTDFVLEARACDWGASLTTDDWVPYTGLGALNLLASLDTSGITVNEYNALAEEDAFAAAVNLSGETRIVLNSSRHRLTNTPSGDEYVGFHSSDGAHPPLMTVHYTAGGVSLTAQFSAVVLRRCPLRLILVAEDASGLLVSYRHPVHLTVRYTPRYQVAR
jgi:hypothetical protein